MRNAFTLIEIIFVVTIVGILGMLALPRFGDNDLAYARDQIIQHIRYTQHLALMDDKYLSESSLSKYTTNNQKFKDASLWYKKMWQVQFHIIGTSNADSYTIYSDTPIDNNTNNDYDGNPSSSDLIARDPLTGLLIAGNQSGIDDDKRLLDVDIQSKYGVEIKMQRCYYTNGDTPARHILFDHLGRPYCLPTVFVNEFNPYNLLATAQIKIELTSRDQDKLFVCIEPESGYVHECI